MSKELITLLGGRRIGVLRERSGLHTFHHESGWVSAPEAHPLSISMPLGVRDHRESVVDPFLWGLLPDSDAILDRWARRFQVSPRNPFALLAHMGEDCAGAVQFVQPGREEEVLSGKRDGVEWLDDSEMENRVHLLVTETGTGRLLRDVGQFSLAGAQEKMALLHEQGRWGIPSGRIPTTHILKAPKRDFAGLVENEHLCLRLAAALRLPAARTEVMTFGVDPVIVVERYDREGRTRTHQEDTCQALAIHPGRKYQSDGGPGPNDIIDLLKTVVRGGETGERPPFRSDIENFLRALAFNWIIGGTDAHAKNYSLIIRPRGVVRLAPLYDIASIFPHEDAKSKHVKMAMKIGGEYRLRDIGMRQWRRFAKELRVDEGWLLTEIGALARALPDALRDVAVRVRGEGVDHPVIATLEKLLTERAREIAREFPDRQIV